MMFNPELSVSDVLLIEERFAAIGPSATNWALEVCPHIEGDGGIHRANPTADREFCGGREDRGHRGERVACRRLPAEPTREKEHHKPDPQNNRARKQCVLDDAHG